MTVAPAREVTPTAAAFDELAVVCVNVDAVDSGVAAVLSVDICVNRPLSALACSVGNWFRKSSATCALAARARGLPKDGGLANSADSPVLALMSVSSLAVSELSDTYRTGPPGLNSPRMPTGNWLACASTAVPACSKI